MDRQISQRQAVRQCLSGNEVLEEGRLLQRVMMQFNLSETQARQGMKNSVIVDLKVFRSTYRGRIYYRLAETKVPLNHLDFQTSPVNLKMTASQHKEFILKRDAPVKAPWVSEA